MGAGSPIQYSKYNTSWKTEELSFYFRLKQRIFLYSKAYKPDLSQRRIQWGVLAVSPELKWNVRDADESLSPNVEMKNECRYRPTYLLIYDVMVCTATPVSTLHPGRFIPGMTPYPLYRSLGGSQSCSGRVRKMSTSSGNYPRTVQGVTSRYTNYAIVACRYVIGVHIKPWK